MQQISLEQYYPGDEAWCDFVEIAKDAINAPDFKTDKSILENLSERLQGKTDLAYVIYYFFNNDSLQWIDRQIPILGNLSPIQCITSKDLINRLREALLRTPL